MTTYLLDANVLIALSVAEHEHHDRVSKWAGEQPNLAICPIVEGALVRFLVRIGERPEAAIEILARIRTTTRCEFWPDSRSYVDFDLAHVRGHRQVTDAYLAGLATAHDAMLATLDAALATEVPGATLIPAD